MGDYDDAWDIVTSPCYMSREEERSVSTGWLKVVNYIHDFLPREYAMFFVESGVDEDLRAPAHVDLFERKFVWNPATRDEFRENKLQRGIMMLLGAMRENLSDVDVQEYASLVLWNLLKPAEDFAMLFRPGLRVETVQCNDRQSWQYFILCNE